MPLLFIGGEKIVVDPTVLHNFVLDFQGSEPILFPANNTYEPPDRHSPHLPSQALMAATEASNCFIWHNLQGMF